MERHLYLDLEETIIKSWQEPYLCNVRTITDWLAGQHPFDSVRLFSYAVYNKRDVQIFESDLRELIEVALGLKIVETMTVEQMMDLSRKYTGLRWDDVTDYIQCRGKHYGFFDMCMMRHTDAYCVLLDDVVPHQMKLYRPDLKLEIELVNVTEI